MKPTRRDFLHIGASGLAATLAGASTSSQAASSPASSRTFHFVQIDVFTSHRFQGNQLAVFPDARGLSDTELQDIAHETNLSETTFAFPRDPAVELERGIKVRIFIADQEIPFAGHPTLGTAMVLRNRLANRKTATGENARIDRVSLDLQVGKVPIDFSERGGSIFGENDASRSGLWRHARPLHRRRPHRCSTIRHQRGVADSDRFYGFAICHRPVEAP